jgi:nitrite reductase/ring-hydroxylating ferredoxin subunit
MGTLTKVADTAELTPGECKVVDLGAKTLALFNVDGTYYVLDNTCLHRGGPLGEGELEGPIVTCPWHGWRWDVTTGANTNNPAVKVACFPVKVEGTSVFVEV